MESFYDIYQRAQQRKGGEIALTLLLKKPSTKEQLRLLSDDDWLEEFSRKIFQSGFYWQVVNQKWDGFREVFWEFNVEKLVLMPPEMLEQKACDTRIIRNFSKVKTIPINAAMMYYHKQDHQEEFAHFIADYPSERIVELWLDLKHKGARLGGNTGAYALRAMGKDTFILSRDVESYLRAQGVIDGGLHSKKSLQSIQNAFNNYQQKSGLSLQEISQIIAFSVGDNHVGINHSNPNIPTD